MLIVGLTGGVGSGKSTAADMFAHRGIPVVDTDVIAHDLVQANAPAFNEIVAAFGQDILLEDGQLDRKRLRTLVFSQAEKRTCLERILHPRIRAEVRRQLALLDNEYCVVVIPLLFETAGYDFLDRILVVDTAEDTQLSRAASRDGVNREEVMAIIKSQVSRAVRIEGADDVIQNNGDIAMLESQVAALHEKYLSLAKSGQNGD